MRILLVSQMYPGPADPDLGVFVAQLERELVGRGHTIDRAVLDRRGGGKKRFLELRRAVRRAPKPDVVWSHFLVPAGFFAAGVKAPHVATAHGTDVRNIGAVPGIRWATRRVVRRAASVIAVSRYLGAELEAKVPEARGKVEIVDCGVDLERFAPGGTAAPALAGLAHPIFLAIGSLTERKNVVRLADAFVQFGHGTLVFLGDGPLRAELEGRPGVVLAGRVAHDEVGSWIAGADVVCGPALVEPFGQALLEALACGKPVVATNVGGPPEFVPVGGGVLVNPLDTGDIARGLAEAAALPSPNDAARAAAAEHDVRRQAERVEAILLRAVQGRRA
ncbi:unannotated protein [freshwater metagenome]|uniref:Unannotated protein n=1 Tax=freshwater metagenome TaxID=449393 RepID=A0A6J6QS35_9ZZZZ